MELFMEQQPRFPPPPQAFLTKSEAWHESVFRAILTYSFGRTKQRRMTQVVWPSRWDTVAYIVKEVRSGLTERHFFLCVWDCLTADRQDIHVSLVWRIFGFTSCWWLDGEGGVCSRQQCLCLQLITKVFSKNLHNSQNTLLWFALKALRVRVSKGVLSK